MRPAGGLKRRGGQRVNGKDRPLGIPYELHLAHRNLGRHPWHTLAMVMGLALAVLVMVYIPSTMSSFYDDLIDRAVEQNSAHVTIWPLEKPKGQLERALRREAEGPARIARPLRAAGSAALPPVV